MSEDCQTQITGKLSCSCCSHRGYNAWFSATTEKVCDRWKQNFTFISTSYMTFMQHLRPQYRLCNLSLTR